MISLANINKQYGRQLIFVDASFQLNPGEKVGLVGPNGAGKTTLFRILVGEEAPDEGEVTVPKRLTIGYFRQDVEEMSGRSVLDEAIAGSGRVGDLHHELEALNQKMTGPEYANSLDEILVRFGEVQQVSASPRGFEPETAGTQLRGPFFPKRDSLRSKTTGGEPGSRTFHLFQSDSTSELRHNKRPKRSP
jgi:ATPase subunit of ABC transporter with duplicated ATPase domains